MIRLPDNHKPGKVFERLVFKYLYNYRYNTICQALDRGKEVRVVFCDICKAFGHVWHTGLVYKLKAAGV